MDKLNITQVVVTSSDIWDDPDPSLAILLLRYNGTDYAVRHFRSRGWEPNSEWLEALGVFEFMAFHR